jgi:predicted permease
MTSHTPPRAARALLRKALPADARQDILDYLEESFAERVESGAASARRWYWRQALSFSARFSFDRMLDLRRLISVTDVKLAGRMLLRSPGLTLVGMLGMAVGIAIAAGAYSILRAVADPDLPLDEGDRIVAIQNRDEERGRADRRALHDFVIWKTALDSVVDVGAYRYVERNLIEPGRAPETLRIVEMTASGFRVARVAPAMGRHLEESDERPEAPPVAVIGEEFWRTHLGSTSGIIGRGLQFGDTTYTIVGVMPAGFLFPVRDTVWLPLRLDPLRFKRGEGPSITVFARLADGATLESAQAELSTLAPQNAAVLPDTTVRLRAQVVPYTYPFTSMDDPGNALAMQAIQALMVMLLGVVCINVATLVYARTATRQGEIAVRTALGAGRGRIVAQLFVEALALAAGAAAIGVLLVSVVFRQIDGAMPQIAGGPLPFWMEFGLSARVLMFTAGLAVMSAVIVGVIPALKATGRQVQSGLKTISAGGGAGMQLGRMWTFLIVAQVAFAVALLPPAIFNAWDAATLAMAEPGPEAREFVTADLSMDRSGLVTGKGPDAAAEADRRFAARHGELLRKLHEEPGVAAVTFSLTTPGAEGTMFIEIEGAAAPAEPGDYSIDEGSAYGYLARYGRVDPGYFDTYGVEQLGGRRFNAADTNPAASSIVVNRSFADKYLDGASALGRRVRYVGRGGDAEPNQIELKRWYEIVGVVSDFPAGKTEAGVAAAKIYHAAAPGAFAPSVLSIHLPGGAPAAFAGRLREIAASVDPDLQVRRVTTLAQSMAAERGIWQVIAAVLGGVTFAVVALSAAGIYALMSITVAQRRREIGIRSALGADARQILRGIFARAFLQLITGAAVGMALAVVLDKTSEGDLMEGRGAVLLPLVAAFMTVVGVLAALGPARRGLRIQPTEALRDS